MSTLIKVHNGTKKEQQSLCATCNMALYVEGRANGEVLQVCQASYPAREVPFIVTQCSEFNHAGGPSLKKMEEIAWVVNPKNQRGKVGFTTWAAHDRKEEIGDLPDGVE